MRVARPLTNDSENHSGAFESVQRTTAVVPIQSLLTGVMIMQNLNLVHVVQRTAVTQPVPDVQALQRRRNLGIGRITPISDDLMDCLDRLDDDAFDELMNDDDFADLEECDRFRD